MIKVKDLDNLNGGFPYGRIYYKMENDIVELTYSTTMERWKDYCSNVTLTDEQLNEMEVIEMSSYGAGVGKISITIQQGGYTALQ